MVVLWAFAGIVAAYVVYGFVAPHPYRRVFPAGLAPDRVIDGYLVPREVADGDEAELTRRVSAAFAAQTLRLPKLAGRDDPDFHESHWGHTSAILRGTLKIDRIEALPERFRVGLFSRNRDYQVVARSGIIRDRDLNLAAHRLALKIDYPDTVPNRYAVSGTANELDLLLVAGTSEKNHASHAFFARDGRQLAVAAALKPPSLATLKMLADWRNVALLVAVRRRVARLMDAYRRPPESDSGWSGKPYYSLGPFALGEGAMKFRLTPLAPHPVAGVDPLAPGFAARNRADMKDWIARGDPARFALGIQLATPDCIPDRGPDDPPKGVMAAEYCDLGWDETASPYLEVGTLTLAADDAIDTPEVRGGLQFNAWNTLSSMRPLGQLFRMRGDVHAAHSDVRVAHLFGGTPGAMTGNCPFATADADRTSEIGASHSG